MNKKKSEINITKSPLETQKLAGDFAMLLGNNVVSLYGEMGSGKTTFVQGLALGLGIKRRIVSPTFILVREYKLKTSRFAEASLDKQNSKSFYHIDLYRTETIDDIKGLGIDEIIAKGNNIVAIEWAEKIKNLLPKERVDVYFEYLDENRRRIVINRHNF